MTTQQLEKFVIANLEEHKAKDIVSLDIRKLTDIADYMVICSGTSNRHVKAIANHLVADAKKQGTPPLGVEEEANGSWTLVDLTDVIIHIMLPQTRELYKLEQLWAVDIVKEHRQTDAD